MRMLYHFVPEPMNGTVLHPLNVLKELLPGVYSHKVRKYIGREHLLRERIPTLNCLWNDVIHLAPLHPTELKKALEQAGWNQFTEIEAFELNPEILEKEKTTVYLHSPNIGESGREYEKFDPTNLERYAQIRPETIQYFRKSLAERKRPLLYSYVPHILYKGSIDTSKLNKVKAFTTFRGFT